MQGRVARSWGAARSSVVRTETDVKMRTQECGLLRGGTVSTETLRGRRGAPRCPGIRKEANSWNRNNKGEEKRRAGRAWGQTSRAEGRREHLGLYSGTDGSHRRA